MVNKSDQLLREICKNPRDVRFADACKAAEILGFTAKARSGSSHHAFAKPGMMAQLNFQKRQGGKIKPYQARQLADMIENCWNFEKGELKK